MLILGEQKCGILFREIFKYEIYFDACPWYLLMPFVGDPFNTIISNTKNQFKYQKIFASKKYMVYKDHFKQIHSRKLLNFVKIINSWLFCNGWKMVYDSQSFISSKFRMVL